LAALTKGTAVHWIRLSHYVPVCPEPRVSKTSSRGTRTDA
jgi:hypothetical protein